MPKRAKPARSRGRVAGPKKRGLGLDYGAAARAASKGATARKVARAAGSRARTPRSQKNVGQQILRRLRERGQLYDILAARGHGIEQFADELIQRTKANKTIFFQSGGAVTESREVVDWGTRAEAAQQYMQAIGLLKLPVEAELRRGVLDDVEDELLLMLAGGQASDGQIAEILERIGAGADPGGARAQGAGRSPPAQGAKPA